MGHITSHEHRVTTGGVRVPDVAWASAAFMARHGDLSPIVDEAGDRRAFDARGARPESQFGVVLG